MSSPERRSIFYLEEDPNLLKDYYEVLQERYDVSIGAHWELIKQVRSRPVDLLILDLMIHHSSDAFGTDDVVKNIHYPDVNWRRTGLEFLRRLRSGEYEDFGFLADVPVVVVTAVVTYPALELTEELGISSFLKKPISIDKLEEAVDRALSPTVRQG